MRTDVKVGIALGLAVVLVAALFLLIPREKSPAPVSAASPEEIAATALPESTAVAPTSDDLSLAATGRPAEPAADEGYPPDEAPAAAADDRHTMAPALTPIPDDPAPAAAGGFESSDPASVVEIHPAVAPAPYPGWSAPVEDPLSLPAGYVPPSAGTEVVADDAAPDAGTYSFPSPPVVADPVVPDVAPAPIPPTSYTVQPNDSFWGIAKKLWGDGTKYKLLKAANPRTGTLRPGQTLTVPALPAATPAPVTHAPPSTVVITPQPALPGEYVVKAGDSLWSIALKLFGDGTRSKVIFEANRDRLRNMNDLRIGQSLRLPAAAPPTAMTEIPAE